MFIPFNQFHMAGKLAGEFVSCIVLQVLGMSKNRMAVASFLDQYSCSMRLKHSPCHAFSCSDTGEDPYSLSFSSPLQELQHCLASVPEGLAEREDEMSLSCYLPLLHNELRPTGVMLNEVMEGGTWTTDSKSHTALLLFDPPSLTEQQYTGFPQSWKTLN